MIDRCNRSDSPRFSTAPAEAAFFGWLRRLVRVSCIVHKCCSQPSRSSFDGAADRPCVHHDYTLWLSITRRLLLLLRCMPLRCVSSLSMPFAATWYLPAKVRNADGA